MLSQLLLQCNSLLSDSSVIEAHLTFEEEIWIAMVFILVYLTWLTIYDVYINRLLYTTFLES